MTLIEAGNRNNYYRIYLNLPKFTNREVLNFANNTTQKYKEIEFTNKIYLISNKIYVNMGFMLLGFGLGVEVQSIEG